MTADHARAPAVFSIPDVTTAVREDRKAEPRRVVASRARYRKKLSRSTRTAVLVGVFFMYALVGMLTARAIVWFFDHPESAPQEMARESEPPQSEKRSGLDRSSTRQVQPVSTGRADAANAHDPAITDQLRSLLGEAAGRNQRPADQRVELENNDRSTARWQRNQFDQAALPDPQSSYSR